MLRSILSVLDRSRKKIVSDNTQQPQVESTNLLLEADERAGQKVSVRQRKTTIGSHSDCTVVLNASNVQPLHCLMIRGQAGTVVRNFHPDTRINGEAFGDRWFETGDTLSVGGIDLRHDEPTNNAPAPSQRPSENQDLSAIEDRSEEILKLVDRLTRLEAEIGELREAKVSLEQKSSQAAKELNERFAEIRNLEQQNRELVEQVRSANETSEALDELRNRAQEVEEKTSQLQASLEQKDEIIQQFADRNCQLATEVNQLREQVFAKSCPEPEAVLPTDSQLDAPENDLQSSSVSAGNEQAEPAEADTIPNAPLAETPLEASPRPTEDSDSTPVNEFENAVGEEPDFHLTEEIANAPASQPAAFGAEEWHLDSTAPVTDPQNELEDNADPFNSAEEALGFDPEVDAFPEIDQPKPQDGGCDPVSDTQDEPWTDAHESPMYAPADETENDSALENQYDMPCGETEPELEESLNASDVSDESIAPQENSDTLTKDPFAILAEIDAARSGEGGFQQGFETQTPIEESALADRGSADESANVENSDEQVEDEDSWEASFRREFRDQLATKAARFSPTPGHDSFDTEKREEIASNIAKVESNLNELFRPRESTSTDGPNETNVEPADSAAAGFETESDLDTGNHADTANESDTANETESAVDPEVAHDETGSPAQDGLDGELEFNFELAESNLASAFSGFDESLESQEDDAEVSLDFMTSEADDPKNFAGSIDEETGNNPEPSSASDFETSAFSEPETAGQDQVADAFATLESIGQELLQSEKDPFALDEDTAGGQAEHDSFAGISESEESGQSEEPLERSASQPEESGNQVDEMTGLSTAYLFQQAADDEQSEEAAAPATESVAQATESQSATETSDDADDSYIQEYMKRLLGNEDEPETENQANEPGKSEKQSLLEKTFEKEIKARQEMLKPSEFVPKTSAPEKSSNLKAMRELANQSARSAIETSSRKKKSEKQSMLVLIFSGICFFIGASLVMIAKSAFDLPAMGSVLFFALTGLGAWYYLDLKNSTKRTGNPSNSSQENVSDDKSPSGAATPEAGTLGEQPTQGSKEI